MDGPDGGREDDMKRRRTGPPVIPHLASARADEFFGGKTCIPFVTCSVLQRAFDADLVKFYVMSMCGTKFCA
eukprot:1193224-Prorocentrum_minimum.AAC.4